MNENHSSVAAAILSNYIRPVKKPRPRKVHDRESLIALLLWHTEVQPNGCWIWTGSVFKNGYGRIGIEKRTWRAHRYSYKLLANPIPDGMCVCHKCDNPKCVNPDHLFLGTQKENMEDMDNKRRRRPACGEVNGQSKLTESSVSKIRNLFSGGGFTQIKLAKRFGVAQSLISQIISGKLWKQSHEQHRTGLDKRAR